MKIERLAEGLGAAEGPAFLPDGRFICVEIWNSRISVWTEEEGLQEHVHVGGGPNSVLVAPTARYSSPKTAESTGTGVQPTSGRRRSSACRPPARSRCS